MTVLVNLPKEPLRCHNFAGGKSVETINYQEVRSPYTGGVIGHVALSNQADVDRVVAEAAKAWPGWARTPIKERTQILLKFRDVVLHHLDDLSHTAAAEAGKTVAEARAGILKGIEVSEFAASLQNIDDGSFMEVSRGVTCESRRVPLGVVCGIAPFNFPAMVPMWMYPIALTLGNCFILKPSEKVPLTSQMMVKMASAAGFPPGVFSLVNGDRRAVEALVQHPAIKAVGFVGSSPVAKSLYAQATALGKRALCLGGAKNQSIVVPDCDPAIAIQGVLDSFTGCAGQRCMALSLLLAVGDGARVVDGLIERAKTVTPGAQLGAIIDRAAKEKIENHIQRAITDGAKVVLDGRKAKPPQGYEGGFWLGPTIIDHARADMACARDEIFGPVLTIVRCPTLADALAIENTNPFGNATSVFTTSGAVARHVCDQATAGMLGVNIGVPVPREPFSFGGTKESKFGHGDITGVSAVGFWTDIKKTTTKWTMEKDRNWMS